MADTLVERATTLPPAPDSPGAARQLLRDVLDQCGREDWRDAAELALSELATNSVLHAHTVFEVRIRCGDDELRVEVEDASAVVPAQRAYGAEAATGRGLALVAVVAHEHGVTRTGTGKVVWFVLRDEPMTTGAEDIDTLLDDWGDDDLDPPVQASPLGSVTLLNFPPTLWLAAMQMHDALVRELALVRAGQGQGATDLAAADRARFAIRAALQRALSDERVVTAARSPLPPGHPADLQAVPPALDLEVPLWPGAADDAAALQDVMDEANRLARQGLLLTRPSLTEVTALRDWAAEQIITGSTATQAPMPWPGADAEQFAHQQDDAVRQFDYDVRSVIDGARTAVVVDGQNRILGISDALATEIGWDPSDLVGRRVVAIVPPRYREAHIAGLTRHLSTGQAHALRVDLQLPVLRADGTEVLCDFWIDADRTATGQPVYIAYISPAEDQPPG